MVAKINVGNSLYGTLMYNQKKIDEGEGRVLCSNKMTENVNGNFSIHSCMADFENQMPQDIKTEKPIIHISLNPHPDDKLTDEQLAAIAQEYMQKLGYGNQPYMVYKHEDIDRRHIHIVSLRVDETGRKIDDRFEHRRSKDITRELEQKYGLRTAEKRQRTEAYQLKKVVPDKGDVKSQIAGVIKPLSASYHFQSFNEYRALLTLYNIGVEEVKGVVRDRQYNGLIYCATDHKGGKIGNPFKSFLFGKSVGFKAIEERCEKSKEVIKEKNLREPTREAVAKALQATGNRTDFEIELAKGGISVLMRENKEGRIYGVTFIDHNTKCVLNGSRLGKEFSANVINNLDAAPVKTVQPIQPDNTAHLFEPNSAAQTDNAIEGGGRLIRDGDSRHRFRRRGIHKKNEEKTT